LGARDILVDVTLDDYPNLITLLLGEDITNLDLTLLA
jgi:hypothetical protein